MIEKYMLDILDLTSRMRVAVMKHPNSQTFWTSYEDTLNMLNTCDELCKALQLTLGAINEISAGSVAMYADTNIAINKARYAKGEIEKYLKGLKR